MKYAALGEHLRQLPEHKPDATLKFDEIERIIGAKLPKSASTYREWWANQQGGSGAPHWSAAGFEVKMLISGARSYAFADRGRRVSVTEKRRRRQKR